MIEVCLDLSVPTAVMIDVTLSLVEDTALCEWELCILIFNYETMMLSRVCSY